MRSVADKQPAGSPPARLSCHGRASLARAGVLALLGGMLAVTSLVGCSAQREQTKSPRGAMEQLLLSRSVQRSLYDIRLPTLKGANVALEIQGLAPDMAYVKSLVVEHLGLQDGQIRENKAEAKYLVTVMVHSLGTEQATSLIGMPEVSAGIFPIALPELALYKEQLQTGYARLSISVSDVATGALKETVSWRAGSAYYNVYTVFFWFTFPATDLVQPPTPASGFDYGMKHSTGLFVEPEEEDSGIVHEASP